MNYNPQFYRLCIVSRKLFAKNDLYRIVKVNNTIYFDKNQNIKGRGAYIQKNLSIIQEAQKRHSLSKALRMDVDDSIYLELIQALSKERR